MSLAHQQSHETCEYCAETFDWGYNADYCSEECLLAQKGENALRNLEQDHRFCGTCWKPLKVVFRPADSETPELRKKSLIVRESFVGFETLTEYGETGDYGVECSCGNVDHYGHEPVLRDNEPYEWFLKLAFSKFRKEGQIHQRFDLDTFADTFWESQHLEYAVGKALHG